MPAWGAETSEFLEFKAFKASLVYRVPNQPRLYRKTLSWKKKSERSGVEEKERTYHRRLENNFWLT